MGPHLNWPELLAASAKGLSLVAYMALERWLGRTEKVKSSSVLDLVISALTAIFKIIRRPQIQSVQGGHVMVVEKNVKVAQAADQLMAALASITLVSKQALKDGFQPGSDLPPVLSVSLTELVKVVGALGQLPEEAKQDKAALARAVALGAIDIAEAAIG